MFSPAESPDDDDYRRTIQMVPPWRARPRGVGLWKTPLWSRPSTALELLSGAGAELALSLTTSGSSHEDFPRERYQSLNPDLTMAKEDLPSSRNRTGRLLLRADRLTRTFSGNST